MSAKDSRPGMRLLRAEDRPCEWMRAGLIVYRLCDHDGDCETCPLDAAMRGGRTRQDLVAPTSTLPTGNWRFPADRRYHGGHLWVRQQRPGVLRCGVDAFVVMLCASPSRLVLPAADSSLDAGKAATWIGMDSGLMARLQAPVSGMVLRRNLALQEQPTLVCRTPYDAGWLFEMQGTLPDDSPELMDAAAMRKRAESQRADLMEQLHTELAKQYPDLQRVAADGGEITPDLMRSLDREFLTNLLDGMLG